MQRVDVGANVTAEAESGATIRATSAKDNNVTSAAVDDGVKPSASGLLSDTVLLRLMARRRQTASIEPSTVDSVPTADRQRSATNRAKARRDGKSTTGRTPNTVRPKTRQACSSTYDYRHISAAISRWQYPATKHLMSRPSPENSDTPTDTAVGRAERDHAHPAQGVCFDDVSSQSSMTSHSRLSATTNEIQTQTCTTSSTVKCPNLKLAIITDMGFTPQQYTWLREVNRCLNPHRHHWSDKFARVS